MSNNQLPPQDAVRVEELVNYFTYDYPQPAGSDPFSINTEASVCPWNAEHKLVLVGLQGKKMEIKDLPASNLVFLIDVSGSIQDVNKLPLLKSAFHSGLFFGIIRYAAISSLIHITIRSECFFNR